MKDGSAALGFGLPQTGRAGPLAFHGHRHGQGAASSLERSTADIWAPLQVTSSRRESTASQDHPDERAFMLLRSSAAG